MTAFTGGFIGGSDGYQTFYPGVLPENIVAYEEVDSDLSLIPAAAGSSARVGSVIVDIGENYYSYSGGKKGTSVQRKFLYDTVHLYTRDFFGVEIGAEFSLGAITSDTFLDTFIWNAYINDYIDLEEVTSVGSVGIDNQFPGNAPLTITLKPFEEVLWKFLVRKDIGPVSFSALITLRTYAEFAAVYKFLGVIIRGSRSDLLAFTHNWSTPCTETLEWLTAVNTAHDGTEHRAALRDVARRYLDVTFYLTRDSARKLDHLLYSRQPGYFTTPIHPLAARITSPYDAGDLNLACDTVGRGFVAGSSVALVDPLESSGDTMQIEEVFPFYLRLAAGGSRSWPRGAVAYPAGAARLIGDLPLVWETKDFATAVGRLEFQPAWVPAHTPHAGSGYETYDPSLGGAQALIEVINHEPDWAGGLQRNFSYESGVTDSQTGAISVYETRKRPARTITHNWLLRSYAEVEDFRAFLYRRRGRAVPFWAPTWVSDFRSKEEAVYTGGNELYVYDNGFLAYSLQADYDSAAFQERSNLQIELKNGTRIQQRIVGAEFVDDVTTRIILAYPMFYSFKPSDILRISWLNLYRLADDSVTLEWLTPGVARISLPMVTVPDYLVDPGYIPGEVQP